jgi:hypothetical protein
MYIQGSSMIKKKGYKEAKQEKDSKGKRYYAPHSKLFKFMNFVRWDCLYKIKMPICGNNEKYIRKYNKNPVPVI